MAQVERHEVLQSRVAIEQSHMRQRVHARSRRHRPIECILRPLQQKTRDSPFSYHSDWCDVCQKGGAVTTWRNAGSQSSWSLRVFLVVAHKMIWVRRRQSKVTTLASVSSIKRINTSTCAIRIESSCKASAMGRVCQEHLLVQLRDGTVLRSNSNDSIPALLVGRPFRPHLLSAFPVV